ncbi:MAG: class D sortase [Anaerolineales bacterium]|nr:class D sortase [Anaerolineales bacterium]MCA9930471.1 class D sortase [Anaerolineales bacterium]
MKAKRLNELSVSELEELLYHKKYKVRRQRLQRLQNDGRVVDIEGVSPPSPTPPTLNRPFAVPTGAMREAMLAIEDDGGETAVSPTPKTGWGRRLANRALLLVEIVAVVGLAYVLISLWRTQSELNQELAQAQRAEVQSLDLPTPTARPVIDVAILPTGHRFIEGALPVPEESGDIPQHLLPIINAYQSPPIPPPGPQQARRIQIPAIGVDSTIVEGVYDWEQLKKGVGHQIDSAQPGKIGNMVLAAHNDIYGEIFRHLDQLSPGDEIIVSTERQSFTYVVNNIDVVDPVAGVYVMAPTDHASTTLISCYPYRINTERIVVFADLVTDG